VLGRKRAILILVLEKQKKRCKVSQVKWKDTRCVTSAQIVRSAHFLALLGAAAAFWALLAGRAALAGAALLAATLAIVMILSESFLLLIN